MFVAWGVDEVELEVELVVLFIEAVVVRGLPERNICESVEVELWVPFTVALFAITCPIANIVVDPRVVVRVVEIGEVSVIVERMADVVTAEDVCTVIVEE